MEQQLYCGAAKRCITPNEVLRDNLRGLMDQQFGGVLHEIYLRVIALKNREEQALFICFELDKVPQPERYMKEITERFLIKEENILLTAVHTHSAPITGYRPFEGPNFIERKPQEIQDATHEYEDFIHLRLMDAVVEAIGKMVPAKMGYTTTNSYINVDRKQWYEYRDELGSLHRKLMLGARPEQEIDHTVYVVKFENLEGKEIAFWVNYPVHCCVLHTNQCCDGKLGISGDIAGVVSSYIEAAYPESIAVWCSGAAGDINPMLQNELYYPDPITGEMVTHKMENGDCKDFVTYLAANHFDDIRRTIPSIACHATDVPISSCVEWSKTPGVTGNYEVRLQMMKIGNLVMMGGSGEFFNSYAKILRDILPHKDVVMINHVCSLCVNSGYIFDSATLNAPELDLPGSRNNNMVGVNFEASFIEHALHMFETL